MQQKQPEDVKKKGSKSLMQRNVTEFKHFLTKSYINEDDLNWVMGLRDNKIPKTIEHRDPSAPDVFFKKTMISTIRDQLKSKDEKMTINVGEYGYMMTKKLQKTPQKQTLQQIKFYNQLRKSKVSQKINSSKSTKQFDIIPHKERHEYPAFIKKEHIKKVRVKKEELQSAFDGAQNNQPYSNKMKTRNYAFFEPMARARGRNRVELPVLAWEMGLRNY